MSDRGRWRLPRLMGYEAQVNLPDQYLAIYRRIYMSARSRTPTHADQIAIEKAGYFFARAWSIERARRVRAERELAKLAGAGD